MAQHMLIINVVFDDTTGRIESVRSFSPSGPKGQVKQATPRPIGPAGPNEPLRGRVFEVHASIDRGFMFQLLETRTKKMEGEPQ